MIDRPRLHPLVSLVLAVAIGLLIGAGQAPMGVWPATIAGVALFTWLMAGRSGEASFGLGYVVGLAMNALTVSWVSVLGVGVGVALVAFLSLWWGLMALAISKIVTLRAWPVLVPAVWVAMEFASGKVPFGGFSWTRLAYTTIDQPMNGLLAWIGVAGVSYLVALVANLGLLAVIDGKLRLRLVAAITAVFVLGGALNLVPQAMPTETVTVAVVQPNVNRLEHGTGTYARSVTNNAVSETVFTLAEARAGGQDVDFVLWPENATDVDPELDAEVRRLVELTVDLAGVPVLVGAVTVGPEPDTRQTTSIWWAPETGPGAKYHKRDLVPFGEWIPFRDFLLPRMPILEQIGRQSIPGEGPGVLAAPVERFPDLVVGSIICFELAYDDTSYDTALHGGDVIVSQSNTNTYGGSFQVHQQLTINRVRAMELGREVIASTLNSVTASIDSRGRVVEATQEFTADHMIVTVPIRDNINSSVHVAPVLSWVALGVTFVALGAAAVLTRRRPG